MATTSSEPLKATISLEVVVDPDWIELVTGGAEGFCDVFIHGYCGTWLTRIRHDVMLGWLAYDYAAEDRDYTEAEVNEALVAWREGKPLPTNFYRLDLETTKKSWVAGYMKDGAEWFENGDGNVYDNAIQMALFNEVVYC